MGHSLTNMVPENGNFHNFPWTGKRNNLLARLRFFQVLNKAWSLPTIKAMKLEAIWVGGEQGSGLEQSWHRPAMARSSMICPAPNQASLACSVFSLWVDCLEKGKSTLSVVQPFFSLWHCSRLCLCSPTPHYPVLLKSLTSLTPTYSDLFITIPATDILITAPSRTTHDVSKLHNSFPLLFPQ